jgi:hypothetical protein
MDIGLQFVSASDSYLFALTTNVMPRRLCFERIQNRRSSLRLFMSWLRKITAKKAQTVFESNRTMGKYVRSYAYLTNHLTDFDEMCSEYCTKFVKNLLKIVTWMPRQGWEGNIKVNRDNGVWVWKWLMTVCFVVVVLNIQIILLYF